MLAQRVYRRSYFFPVGEGHVRVQMYNESAHLAELFWIRIVKIAVRPARTHLWQRPAA